MSVVRVRGARPPGNQVAGQGASRLLTTVAMSPAITPETAPSIAPASSRMSGAVPVALVAGSSRCAGTCPAGLLANDVLDVAASHSIGSRLGVSGGFALCGYGHDIGSQAADLNIAAQPGERHGRADIRQGTLQHRITSRNHLLGGREGTGLAVGGRRGLLPDWQQDQRGARDRHRAGRGGSNASEQAHCGCDAEKDRVPPDDLKEPAQVRCPRADLASASIPAPHLAWRRMRSMIRPAGTAAVDGAATDGHEIELRPHRHLRRGSLVAVFTINAAFTSSWRLRSILAGNTQ